jgi:hypothetical protein
MTTKAAQALPTSPKSGGRAHDDRPHVADGQAQDFSDPESQRVLAAAARAVARELAREPRVRGLRQPEHGGVEPRGHPDQVRLCGVWQRLGRASGCAVNTESPGVATHGCACAAGEAHNAQPLTLERFQPLA